MASANGAARADRRRNRRELIVVLGLRADDLHGYTSVRPLGAAAGVFLSSAATDREDGPENLHVAACAWWWRWCACSLQWRR
jgi:hypothetical protein